MFEKLLNFRMTLKGLLRGVSFFVILDIDPQIAWANIRHCNEYKLCIKFMNNIIYYLKFKNREGHRFFF